MSKLQKMQTIIAKLLRQAEDVVGTPEEAVFQAKAFELMAKYGLDMANIEATKQGLDVTEIPDAIKWSVNIDGKYADKQMLLLHNMAMAMHCKTVYAKVSNGYKQSASYTLHVFGVPRHIERLQLLWDLLRPQMLRLVEKVRPDHVNRYQRYDWRTGESRMTSGAGQVKAYRRAWIAGFANSVGERLRAEESKAVESAGGGALVLYKSDVERAAVALRAAFPRTGRAKRSSYNRDGYAAGQRDGRSASFNRALAG